LPVMISTIGTSEIVSMNLYFIITGWLSSQSLLLLTLLDYFAKSVFFS